MYKLITVALTVLILFGTAYSQDEKQPQRIVVAEFANKTGDETLEWINHGLRSDLTRRLLRVKDLVVLDTPAFQRVRNDLGLTNKDLSEPGEALKAGKALGVDKVLVGHYTKAPTGVKVVARLVDTESGSVTEPEFSKTGSPISVTAGLALDIAKALGIEIKNASSVTRNLTSNSDAYESYCKGLTYKESVETYEKAIQHFIKATEQDSEYAAPHFELGWLFTITGPAMYRSAVKEYKKATALYAGYAEAYNNLGVLYTRLNQPQSARTAYLKAIESLPGYVDAHFNLGRLYDTLEQFDKAIAEYRKTVKLNPADAVAHNNLAVALLNKGDNDEALASYIAALKLVPDLKEAHLGLGLIFDSKGDRELAIKHYQKFLDLGGFDEDINQRLEQLKKEEK